MKLTKKALRKLLVSMFNSGAEHALGICDTQRELVSARKSEVDSVLKNLTVN